jgi:hypothetical protein
MWVSAWVCESGSGSVSVSGSNNTGETDPNKAKDKTGVSSASAPFFKIATKSTKSHKNDFFVIFVSFVVHFGRVERFVREKAAPACACTHADRSRGIPLAARFYQFRHTFSPSQRRQAPECPRYLVGGEGFVFSISIAIAISISMIAMIQ